jgi:hypothetical protein
MASVNAEAAGVDDVFARAVAQAEHRLFTDNGFDNAEVCSDLPAPLDWIRYYFTPYYAFDPAGVKAGYSIVCCTDPDLLEQARVHARSGTHLGRGRTYQRNEVEDYRAGSWTLRMYTDRPAALLVAEDRRRVCFLTGPADPQAVLEPARHLREYFSRRLERQGFAIFHIGVVAWGDRGVAVMGSKGAGKSTSVVALMEAERASFVANDRAYIGRRDGSPHVVTWPTTAKLGVGTAYGSPRLRQWLRRTATFSYPQEEATPEEREHFLERATDEERWAARQKIELTPDELAGTLGVGIRAEAGLSLLVFPRISPACERTSVEEADRDWVIEELIRESFTPDDRSYPDWLGLREQSTEALRQRTRELAGELARSVPAFRIVFRTAPDLAREVRALMGP